MYAEPLKEGQQSTTMGRLCSLLVVCLAIVGYLATPLAVQAADSECDAIDANMIYRFVEGIDECMLPLSDSEVEELTDPFAESILRQGFYPTTMNTIDDAIYAQLGYGVTVYLVGEGSQVPDSVASRDQLRGLRYLLTWGVDENDGQIMSSKLTPAYTTSFIEVISFDERTGEYNYYLFRPQVGHGYDFSEEAPGAWAWVGNTSMAFEPETMDNGCFRCHHNGIPIMRELEAPWSHWQSQRAMISSSIVPEDVATERFFLPRRGAEVMEGLVRGSIQNYYQTWLSQRMEDDGHMAHLVEADRMLRHLTTNTTINFKSADIQTNRRNTGPEGADILGVPPRDTFLADSLLQTVLDIDYSSLSVELPRAEYEAFLNEHNFKIVGTEEFYHTSPVAYEQPGSTYFAMYVPQVPAEDILMTQLLLESGVITEKFAAATLMVDYKNPLFSEKRASLQSYVEMVTEGTIADGESSITADVAAAIMATGAEPCGAESFDDCSAEEQFLYTWTLPDDSWRETSATEIQAYVDSISSLPPAELVDTLMRWSIHQRDRFLSTPRFCNFYEASSMMPQNDLAEYPECPPLEIKAEEADVASGYESAYTFEIPGFINDFPDEPELYGFIASTWNDYLDMFTERALQNNPWNFTNQGPYMSYFNPADTVVPDDAPVVLLGWTLYPNRVRYHYPEASREELWAYADDGPPPSDHITYDNYRDWQDEYGEWSVTRNDEETITKIQFTSETREYWYALWDISPEKVLELYRQLASEEVQIEDLYLRDNEGNPVIDPQTGYPAYDERNRWNGQEGGHAVHMIAASNFYGGALFLTAESTILRDNDRGGHLSEHNEILNCSWQGTTARNSDPSISAFVNDLVGNVGVQITLRDPVGIYIQEPNFDMFQLPDNAPEGAHVSDYWHVIRGRARHDGESYDYILHATFEVPEDHGFTVGDILLNGYPIEYGAQMAETITVIVPGVGIPLDETPELLPCVGVEESIPYPEALREEGLMTIAERSALSMWLEQGLTIENIQLKTRRGDADSTIEFVGEPGVTATITGFEDGFTDKYGAPYQIFTLTITATEDASLGPRAVLLTNSEGVHGPARLNMIQVVEPGSTGYSAAE